MTTEDRKQLRRARRLNTASPLAIRMTGLDKLGREIKIDPIETASLSIGLHPLLVEKYEYPEWFREMAKLHTGDPYKFFSWSDHTGMVVD
jgi:hypothetical protein